MAAASLTLASPAKINLWLRILGKREDGFHALESRMCPLELADTVVIEKREGASLEFTCSDSSLPTDETNLAVKAVRSFQQKHGFVTGWKIHLEKHIPHGAGLGGGSSNAAMVLKGLNELSGYPLSHHTLLELAAEIGSDAPFFLEESVCDAEGRGERVTPVPDFAWKLPLVLIKPSFGIPTPWAYQEWSRSERIPGVLYAPQLGPWGSVENDLERPVFSKWTLLPTLKSWLLDQKETHTALMSGSGSTLFAITRDLADASDLARKAQELCGPHTWVKVTRTR